MTEADIDNLKAGRALDALVAQHVMGWHDIQAPKRACGGFGSVWLGKPPGKRRGSDLAEFQSYSVDREAALNAADKVIDDFVGAIRFQCTAVYPEGGDAPDHVASFDGLDGWVVEANACTLPLAICRATLKATVTTRRRGQHEQRNR